MENQPVKLTPDEVSTLQEAVERIVSSGIRVQDTELQIPAGEAAGSGNGQHPEECDDLLLAPD